MPACLPRAAYPIGVKHDFSVCAVELICLPVPIVGYDGDEYYWITEAVRPQSIGRLSAFMGNAGVLMRAYVYARMLGREGMHRVIYQIRIILVFLKIKFIRINQIWMI